MNMRVRTGKCMSKERIHVSGREQNCEKREKGEMTSYRDEQEREIK